VIQFTKGSADLPKISAIEIKADSGIGIQLSPTSASLPCLAESSNCSNGYGHDEPWRHLDLQPAGRNACHFWSDSRPLTRAPSSITTAQTVRVTATSVADPTQASIATVSLVSPYSPIFVHSGGAAYTDTLAQAWSAGCPAL